VASSAAAAGPMLRRSGRRRAGIDVGQSDMIAYFGGAPSRLVGRMTLQGLVSRVVGRPRAFGCVVSAAVAGVLVGVLVGTRVLVHPASAVVGSNPTNDFQIMTWSLAWWPWAIGHGANPLHTSLLWPPAGFSTVWMTTVPAPTLLALPLTLAFGPLLAYNVLMFAAVVLASAAAYLLCHELTHRVMPSVVGGLTFGLSPYMLGHTVSQHLNLTFVFPLPLLVLLGIRRARGRLSARRFVLGFALLLLVLAGSSLELFADATFLLVVCGLVALSVTPARRKALLEVAKLIGVAYACCTPVLAPPLVLALLGSRGQLQAAPANFSLDLWNLIVPTPTLAAGSFHPARALTSRFVGNIGERDGYLGVPLLAVCALALRKEWRRGAWLAGLLMVAAIMFSLGPEITLGGRARAHLPFSTAQLPVFSDALPGRFSVFAALGAACLCSLWLAHVRLRAIRQVAIAALAVSLLPNFWAPHRIANAWGVSDAFAWSTRHAPAGFVAARSWTALVHPGSTVLVIPTRGRTAASYWQASSGMRFRLAIPETPFVPPSVAADPTVARLADDVLPQLDGPAIGAARLAAFLRRDHVAAVVVSTFGGRRWTALVRTATGAPARALGGMLVFPVAPSASRAAVGEIVSARAGTHTVRGWLRFDGRRAHLHVLLEHGGRRSIATVSSATGDAEAPSVAIDADGLALVVFTEWRAGRLLLRAATNDGTTWKTATLEQTNNPIWTPRAAVTANGTALAGWIDDHGSSRTLRLAARNPHASWRAPVVLDTGQGLGAFRLRSGDRPLAVAAWHDTRARMSRIRADVYTSAGWNTPTTLADSFDELDQITIGPNAATVGWRLIDKTSTCNRALRDEATWTQASRPKSSTPPSGSCR
jgi:hypothetical protein